MEGKEKTNCKEGVKERGEKKACKGKRKKTKGEKMRAKRTQSRVASFSGITKEEGDVIANHAAGAKTPTRGIVKRMVLGIGTK